MKLLLLTILAAAMAAAEETSVEEMLQTSNDHFTAKMFSEVVKTNPSKSVVISAFSVLTPLAQLALASEGASHDELLRALHLPNDNATKEVFGLVNRNLRSVKGVDLKMASKVYIREGAKINQNFQAVSRDLFGSEVKNVDFTKNTQTAGEINSWVEDQTNHRIKDLVSADSLTADTRAVLVNAIYFKGKWKVQFKKEATIDSDFHVSKDKTVKVPMMKIKGDYLYTESKELNAKLLRLPYEGDEASMLIVLPNEIDGLGALEEKLKDPEALKKATSTMYIHEVDVSLPRFKIETTTDLKAMLEKIGVTRVFTSEAKLNNLIEDETDLFVSEAKQKAFIEVNEEGAEAAAGNEFGVAYLSAVIHQQAEFRADHPFLFYLSDDTTVLFNGIYEA